MNTPKSYSVIISSIRQVRVSAICVTLITIFLFLSNSSIGKAQSTNELLANFEDLAQGTSGINIVDGGRRFAGGVLVPAERAIKPCALVGKRKPNIAGLRYNNIVWHSAGKQCRVAVGLVYCFGQCGIHVLHKSGAHNIRRRG